MGQLMWVQIPSSAPKIRKYPKRCFRIFLSIETGFERERRSSAAGKRQVNLSFSATDRSNLQSTSMSFSKMLCKLQEQISRHPHQKSESTQSGAFGFFKYRDGIWTGATEQRLFAINAIALRERRRKAAGDR